MESLREWFLLQRRDLPWRRHPTPYRVWVSEVMLQQTRASVVIPYFERWMERFPTIPSLAAAPLDDIIKAWEGLGYYSRARNLHAGAQMVVDRFNGELPRAAEELSQIKGLGPYTVAAIRAFAFHERAAPVDGNVRRVLCRLYAEELSPAELSCRAEALLPEHGPWEVAEALIELGATHCSRTPDCTACPLQSRCRAYATDQQTQFPATRRIPITLLQRTVAVVLCDDHVLVRRNAPGAVMADLYEFPYVEGPLPALFEQLQLEARVLEQLPQVVHTFTRYRATLTPHLCLTEKQGAVEGCEWRSLGDLPALPFSSGHRRILLQVARHSFLVSIFILG